MIEYATKEEVQVLRDQLGVSLEANEKLAELVGRLATNAVDAAKRDTELAGMINRLADLVGQLNAAVRELHGRIPR